MCLLRRKKSSHFHGDLLFQKPEETKGFFTKAYDGLYQEYYTDLYYLAVGKVENPLGESFLLLFW